MKTWSIKQSVVVGVTLILVTNIIVLSGVAYNRSGEPDALILLTEREVELPYRFGYYSDENSGLSLTINWRILGKIDDDSKYRPYGNSYPEWLNKDKLIELGFDVSENIHTEEGRRSYRKGFSKDALLVLEYNGASYEESVQRTKTWFKKKQASDTSQPDLRWQLEIAQDRMKDEQETESRLFVIDTGLNHEALRKKYADKSKFIIVPGRVEIAIRGCDGSRYFTGRISELGIKVHVPYEYAEFLLLMSDEEDSQEKGGGPKYKVNLAFGQRLEPWVVGINK